ncbi:MAG: PHP domain-containing protein [Peptostreptococcaceae bacterium]|nr:PHP domain-containing protein [Peptostreptococcaceae bacterium]
MESNIDLHVHTYYSDGTLSPTEIIKWAKKTKLDQVSITDHDGVEGVQEALIAGEALEIVVIPGIELSADESNGIGMHILGYRIDIHNKELNNKLEYIKQKRKERNDKVITVLSDLGYPLFYEDMKKRGNGKYIGKPDFARGLINKGYITKFSEAFEMGQFLMSEKVRKIKKEKISAEEAIELIYGAGGIAVLAHPMKVTGLSGEYFKALENLIIKLKDYGLKGMECFYPEHSEEETMKLVNLAEKYKLHVTKGSDYHGPKE